MSKFILVVLAGLAQLVFAQDKMVIISIGDVSKWCEASCQEIVETALVEHCERGCRFFDLAQQSEMLRINDSMSLMACSESCNEAYKDERNRNACITGCNQFPEEQEKSAKMAEALREEARKQMSLISSIMDIMTSGLWNQPMSDDASYEFEDDSSFPIHPKLGLFDDSLSKLNTLENKNFDDEVELIPFMGDDLSSISENRPSICDTRQWLHTLSVILVLLGSVLLVGLGVYYAMALRFKKVKKMKNLSIIEASLPPSYDVAIRSDYIGLPKVSVPVHGQPEKDCKSLI